jgi:hypothetical protein
VISDTELRDVRTDCGHDPRDLVTKHRWRWNDIASSEQKVGMTQPGRSHLDENFAPNRRGDVHVLEIEPSTECVNYKCLHLRLLSRLHFLTHRKNSRLRVAMRSDEDDRYSAPFGVELRLQFKTGHARHANVGDQARGLVSGVGIEELFRGAEAECRQPRRFDQISY